MAFRENGASPQTQAAAEEGNTAISPRVFRWSLGDGLSGATNFNTEAVNQMLRDLISRQELAHLPPTTSTGATGNHHNHHRHHHHHSRGHGQQQPNDSATSTADASNQHHVPDSVVVNLPTEAEASANESSDNLNNNGAQSYDQIGANDYASVLRVIEKYIPFMLLLLIKLMYEHRLGVLVLIGLFATLYHGNKTIKKEVSKKHKRSKARLAWIALLVCSNIFLIYFVFADEKLYNVLIFMSPVVEKWDIWTLIWVVGVCDFVVKFTAIALKALVAMLPNRIIPFKKRGRFYMIIEEVSHFYRAFLPVNPWVYYLSDSTGSGGLVFAIVLVLGYSICKGLRLIQKLKEFSKAVNKFLQKTSYGVIPGKDDLQHSGSTCPICQDQLCDPIMLNCKHIFCEECVSAWFDRERTCPMCRANIIDDPKWRDGATVGTLQIF